MCLTQRVGQKITSRWAADQFIFKKNTDIKIELVEPSILGSNIREQEKYFSLIGIKNNEIIENKVILIIVYSMLG